MGIFNSIGNKVVNGLYSLINKFITFKVVLLNKNAKLPVKADSGCAGYDIFSSESFILYAGKRQLVSTGISTEFSKDFYLRVAPRSGMSVKGIDVGAGVIDSSYRGEIKVLLINNSDINQQFKTGDKIAQVILERCSNTIILETDILSETERGYGGFGSTGN